MIYVFANVAYFVVLTQDEILASNAVAVVSTLLHINNDCRHVGHDPQLVRCQVIVLV